MKKNLVLTALLFAAATQLTAQINTGVRTVKPANTTPNTQVQIHTLQDTLQMLMARVAELETQRLAGGKKTVKTIIPNANNFCFPFKSAKNPSETYFQGVVVDDPVCNNNPNAVLIVTVKTKDPQQPFPVSVSYDAADGKWKISLKGYLVSRLARYVSCYSPNGQNYSECPSGIYSDVAIMSDITLTPKFNSGIEFNVLITERGDYSLPVIRKRD